LDLNFTEGNQVQYQWTWWFCVGSWNCNFFSDSRH